MKQQLIEEQKSDILSNLTLYRLYKTKRIGLNVALIAEFLNISSGYILAFKVFLTGKEYNGEENKMSAYPTQSQLTADPLLLALLLCRLKISQRLCKF